MLNKLRPLRLHALVAPLLMLAMSAALASPITAGGVRMAAQIDSLQVEQHWPAGLHVDWETGVPDGRQVATNGKHTHCSAFVASAAKSLGIYILRPPEHSPILLANAQFDWLGGAAGSGAGWRPTDSGIEAQALANQGNLVVAVYRNRKDNRPGHIAIVRPDAKSDALIKEEGPQITQAGLNNFRSTTLKEGFADHSAAFKADGLRYYVHPVSFAQ